MNADSNTLAVAPVLAPTGAAASSAGKSNRRTNNNQHKNDIDIKPYIKPLQIGDRCHVLWRDGTTHLLAKVIERKRNPKQKELVKTTMPPVVASSPSPRIASYAGGDGVDAAAVVAGDGDGEGEKKKTGKGAGKGKLKLLGKGSATIAVVSAESTIADGSNVEEPALKRTKLTMDGLDGLDDVGLNAIAAGEGDNANTAPVNASQAGQSKSPPKLPQPMEKKRTAATTTKTRALRVGPIVLRPLRRTRSPSRRMGPALEFQPLHASTHPPSRGGTRHRDRRCRRLGRLATFHPPRIRRKIQ